jgi:activator of HSP90 ATPase
MKSIRQSVILPAKPVLVYAALMDSAKHSAFTGGKAVISRIPGGKFTAFDGWATGKNLELVESKKIVQAWRASDWPDGVFSKVVFQLTAAGKNTKLTFVQTGVPEEFAKDIASGWKEFYWSPLKKFLRSTAI